MEQYKALKEAGLDRIHSGFESGSDNVLELINKGVSSAQEITAGKSIREAGIELSVYFMPGIGGKALSEENATETARVISEINPDFVRIRTAVIKEGSELWQEYLEGSYQLCSDNDKLHEIRLLIENVKNCTGMLASDHIINLLQDIQGSLDTDRQKMLSVIDEYFRMPECRQKIFQLARRSGLVTRPEDLDLLPTERLEKLARLAGSISDNGIWDAKINNMMTDFI
jgi:radical SAM superfamily enzyme YgiQ (UPF0313 family)